MRWRGRNSDPSTFILEIVWLTVYHFHLSYLLVWSISIECSSLLLLQLILALIGSFPFSCSNLSVQRLLVRLAGSFSGCCGQLSIWKQNLWQPSTSLAEEELILQCRCRRSPLISVPRNAPTKQRERRPPYILLLPLYILCLRFNISTREALI